MRVELYLRECRSLKAKRSMIKPIIDGLRRRHQVAVSEIDNQNAWQRATIGVAAVAPTYAHLSDVLDGAERFVWSFPEVDVLQIERHWIED